MKHGDYFSGVGMFAYAAKQAGLQTVSFCEKSKACWPVLNRHYPDVPVFPDVTTTGAHNAPGCDVFTFGSPCQDLSIAGNQEGIGGERSGLFFEAIRIIRELRERDGGSPRFALWENVPNALNSHNGDDFRAVLSAFLDIGARDVAWRVLDAQWFGVPQRRRRIFLVADFGGESADSVLALSESLRWYPTSRREAREDATGTSTSGFTWQSSRGIEPREEIAPTRSVGAEGSAVFLVDGELNYHGACSVPLQAQDEHRQPVVYDMRGNGDGIQSPTLVGDHLNRPTDFTPVVCMAHGQAGAEVLLDHAPTLNCNHEQPIICADVTNTLRARAGMPKHDADMSRRVGSSSSLRRLTPVECERLMGLPDGYTDVPGTSDTARYQQLGNGIVWQCVLPIFQAMREASR